MNIIARKKSIAWLTIIVGITGVVMSAVIFIFSSKDQRSALYLRDSKTSSQLEALIIRQEETSLKAQKDISAIADKLGKTREELARLSAQAASPKAGELSREFINQLTTIRTVSDNVASNLDHLAKRYASIDQRIGKLEAVILADPQKALELPLLKRDLLALQQQFDRDINALRAENVRVYDLMKWVVGLMALVSLSLVGAAISNLFKREAPKEI